MEAILACTTKGGIGLKGKLPWRLKEDMTLFKTITTATSENNRNTINAVIMGRKTWESILTKFRPLPNRYNIILSTTMKLEPSNQTFVVKSLEEAKLCLSKLPNLGKTFVIGGASIYTLFFKNNLINKVHLSMIQQPFECDRFFDMKLITDQFKMKHKQTYNTFVYFEYLKS